MLTKTEFQPHKIQRMFLPACENSQAPPKSLPHNRVLQKRNGRQRRPFRTLLFVIRRCAFDFFFRTQEHRNTLVQAFGLDVEDALMAIGRRATGLFHQE